MNTQVPAPKGLQYLPYQIEGIDWICNHTNTLLADEMGLGKTIQALGAINALGLSNALIICPASLKYNWAEEIKKWIIPASPIDRKISIEIVTHGKQFIKSAEFTIINYDLLIRPAILKQLTQSGMQWQMIICDEAHYLKNPKAKRTIAVLGKTGVIHRGRRRVMLTGTPVLNRPIELFPMLTTLAHEAIAPYNKYYSFARRYAGAWDSPWGFDVSGASNVEELNKILRSSIMIRRLKKDVLNELPAKRHQVIPLEQDRITYQLIVDEKRQFPKYKTMDLTGITVGEVAGLRHEMARAKIPVAVKHINMLMQDIQKLVVFAYHKDVIYKLQTELSDFHPVVVTGETPPEQRQQAVKDFQKHKTIKIFIGQIQAAGQGITLTAASNVVFVETTWTPGDIAQAVDRCHRIGQKDSVLAQFLVVRDSIEEHIMKRITDKLEVINKVVE